ncbi:Fe-S cluster protein [Candidatus Saccharibacteria bacterium]|nr:Fe-S cluster protein [Candidatus Saccharibacteria bacterium]
MKFYREEILDHAKNPRNWGKLEKPTHKARFTNPLCGDVVEVGLILAGNPPKVKEARFETDGCVVSVAAASMLSEHIKGKTRKELSKLDDEGIVSWFGGTLTSSRRDCALLPLRALRESLGD